MQRITALNESNAPEASKALLAQVKAKFGKVINIFGSAAHSPAALKALLGMFGALAEGSLAGKAEEAIALLVAQRHGCRYCTAVHTGKAKMLGATVEETLAWRKGEAEDPEIKAILDLAAAMVEKRGQVSDEEIQTARDAGVSDAELLEVVGIVALNTFTNYVNALVQTEVDFPAAPPLE